MGIRPSTWLRVGAVTVAVSGLIAVGSVIAYRVLAPAETVTVATTAYPAAPAAQPGVIGSLPAAPLIVDGRLRIYAATRQVRADGPVDARTQRTPYWSYRRWPQELLGVVAAGTTVVGRWSDGDVVALDARTGKVTWRAAGKPPEEAGYEGGSTGAETVYEPEGLYTSGGTVLVRDAAQLRALDIATGRELWHAPMPDCREGGFTTAGGRFVTTDACGGTPAVEFYDVATGQPQGRWAPPSAGATLEVEPLGCAPAQSACTALRTVDATGSRGWLLGEPDAAGKTPVTAAPALDPPGAVLAGEVGVSQAGGDVVARSLRDGAEVWRWRGDGTSELLGAQSGSVHLLTENCDLVTLDPTTGREKSRFLLAYAREGIDWRPGLVRAGDGFVAVERLVEPENADADEADEYFGALPVILART
ncbi:PQQ-binding-like beta-propeller repeat protein [Phytohabitans sp. ZYX-F-186]|uniref:PQQ-binding-like beta-propeller repeat protein n=1 Tax=Phytohabitans maris TaxID=3071409 RepID=A0ABU0ZUG6_9ACTN|nr:PQQ-binding-like beta-propeller repeat protein [Phytohabitans sp. ZYX-F-186]MDQ7910669.1 PQQ-binding-like beta-propeller repeat protein [Phytohabitans sp. ZYX-F-186]